MMNENLNNEMGVVDRTDYEPERTAPKKERSPLMSWGLLLVLPLGLLQALWLVTLWSQKDFAGVVYAFAFLVLLGIALLVCLMRSICYCGACGNDVSPKSVWCPHCHATFVVPQKPVHVYKRSGQKKRRQ